MTKARGSSAGGSLRIVAGRLRGSRLAVPDRPGLRPTPDRVRETLFNWLAPIIDGARCLDLYAGTGALGIEALSRGAGTCVFVERDRELWRLLQDNLARLKVTGAEPVNEEAFGFLAARAARPFDLVFLDPPFDADLWGESARRLEQGGWLGAAAYVYVESAEGARFAVPANWSLHREGRAGTVRFALYRRSPADPLS
ncbi:16S rRNA (guanine(966)-N(2))-methyltransferase RsmD [Dokdonella sp.]|uniref:16S rRNA (guanine(966)-N(2))-methyltransferase RsmD n=1 Tax=Dokdonella sp. TaxID=2291710 RepID=UPI0025C13DC9|nr:16S rRNA (guanine(966)-N(2))-methyltransferase RsmD [Dokdonella sp.]